MSKLSPDKLSPDKLSPEQKALWDLLYTEFHRLNSDHFEGRLTLPEIVLSTRKTFGGYYQPSRHRIVLSWQAYLEHGLPETLNTFRHEVAHIIHPNHSAAFWRVALALGATQKYASPPREIRPRRYVYACSACGKRIERRRRLRMASCAACDRVFNPQFMLQLVADLGTRSGKVSSGLPLG